MKTLTVKLKEKLPSTVNGWGFAGAVDKERIVLSNNDTWVWGKAMQRHLPPTNYIQMKENNPDYTGGYIGAKVDMERKKTPLTVIAEYYKKLGITVKFK